MVNRTHPLTDDIKKGESIDQIHPTSGVDITFRNISYSVQVQDKKDGSNRKTTKTILNRISGICKAGEVTALMGTSGAGKTTLLNLLACRIIAKQGQLQANRKPYSYQTFGNFANYVMQKDVLMQTLTVRETLEFVANLKLNLSKEKKQQRIDEIAKSMKLQKCMDVLVGGHLLKGVSGGEKKRTSIAFQLISDPQVIMLDQPTSGLDSLTSFIIVDYLSELAHKQQKTVLMTIHQPNSEIFQKFDRLILLAEGNLVYQGRADQGIDYFSSRLGKRMPQLMNPAQFFIDSMHLQNQRSRQSLPFYFQTYSTHISPEIEKQIDHAHTGEVEVRDSDKVSASSSFNELLKRDLINTVRNPMILKSRIFQSIFLAIYTGGLYFNAGKQSYTETVSWYSIVGYFFFLSISHMMASLSPVTLVFPSEKEVFLKEENSRLYGVLPYFLSRNIVELPYVVVIPLIFNCIIYWMVGQASTAQQFFLFNFISLLVGFAGGSLGLFIGSIVNDEKANSAVTPIVILPIFIFSGVFKNTANLPNWIGWFQYISPLKYGFLSMMVNETNQKASNVSQLNFDLGMWPSIFVLIGLSLAFRALSLFFLWLLKTKIQ